MSNQQGKRINKKSGLGQKGNDNTTQTSSGAPKVKPRGRMSAFAYFVQSCKEEQMRVNPKQESTSFTLFSKECAEQWKKMNDQEKSSFHEMAEKDKKRYDEEMANFKTPNPPKKSQETKDPDPTFGHDDSMDEDTRMRSLSAYFHFCKKQQPIIKRTMPKATPWQKAMELDRRWNECPENEKRKCESEVSEDLARFEKNFEAFKAKMASKQKDENND